MSTPLTFSEFFPESQFHPDGGVFSQLRDPYAVNSPAGDNYFDLGGFTGDQRIGPIIYPQGNYPLNRTDIFPALTPNFVLKQVIFTQSTIDPFDSIGLYPVQIFPENVTTGVQIEQRFHSGFFDRLAPEGTSTTLTSSVRARLWKNAPYGKTILFNADTLHTEAGVLFYLAKVGQIFRAYVGTKIESNKVEIDKITNPLFNGFMGMDLTYWTNKQDGSQKTIYDTISESIATWGLLQKNKENPAGLLREYAATQFSVRGTKVPNPVLLAPAGLVSAINITNPKEQVVSETGQLALTNRESVGRDIGGPGYNQDKNVPSSIQVTEWGNFRVSFAPIDQGHSRNSASSFLTNRAQFGSVVFSSDDYNGSGSAYTSGNRDIGIMCLGKDAFVNFTLSELVKDNPIFMDESSNSSQEQNPRDTDFIRKFDTELFKEWAAQDAKKLDADYPFHRISSFGKDEINVLPIHTIGMSLAESSKDVRVIHPQYVQFAGDAIAKQLALSSPGNNSSNNNNFIAPATALKIINQFRDNSKIDNTTKAPAAECVDLAIKRDFKKDGDKYSSYKIDSFINIWNTLAQVEYGKAGTDAKINTAYQMFYPMATAVYKIFYDAGQTIPFETWFSTNLSTIKKLTYDKYRTDGDLTEMDMFSFFYMCAGLKFVTASNRSCCSLRGISLVDGGTLEKFHKFSETPRVDGGTPHEIEAIVLKFDDDKATYTTEGGTKMIVCTRLGGTLTTTGTPIQTKNDHNLMCLDYYTTFAGIYEYHPWIESAKNITESNYYKGYRVGTSTTPLLKTFIDNNSTFKDFSTRYNKNVQNVSLRTWCQLTVLRLLVTRSCVHAMIENNIPIPFALAVVRPHGNVTTLSVVVAESGPATTFTMLSDVKVRHHINPNRSGASEFEMSMASITLKPENILKIPNVVIRQIHPEGNGDRIYTSKNLPLQNNQMDVDRYTQNISENMDPTYQPGKNLPADIFVLMLPSICDRSSLVDFFDLSGSFDYFNGNYIITNSAQVKQKVGFQIRGVTTHYPGSTYYNALWHFRPTTGNQYDPYGVPYNYDGVSDHQINTPFQPNPYNTIVHLESYMEKSGASFNYKPGKGVFGTYLRDGLGSLINDSCAWQTVASYINQRH